MTWVKLSAGRKRAYRHSAILFLSSYYETLCVYIRRVVLMPYIRRCVEGENGCIHAHAIMYTLILLFIIIYIYVFAIFFIDRNSIMCTQMEQFCSVKTTICRSSAIEKCSKIMNSWKYIYIYVWDILAVICVPFANANIYKYNMKRGK